MEYKQLASGIIVPKKYKRYPTGIDFFAGCGGFSLGFIRAGFEVVTAVENSTDASHTYMANLGSYPINIHYSSEEYRNKLEKYMEKAFKNRIKKENGKHVGWNEIDRIYESESIILMNHGFHSGSAWISIERRLGKHWPPVRNFHFGDVTQWSGEQILNDIGMEVGEVDCVFGGPPCQGFSRMNHKNRSKKAYDPRNNLVLHFARMIAEIQPKCFVMENVPEILNITTAEGAPILDEFARILSEGGYMSYEATMKALGVIKKEVAKAGRKVTYAVKSFTKKESKPENREQLNLFGSD